jgi:hypothetical protein
MLIIFDIFDLDLLHLKSFMQLQFINLIKYFIHFILDILITNQNCKIWRTVKQKEHGY